MPFGWTGWALALSLHPYFTLGTVYIYSARFRNEPFLKMFGWSGWALALSPVFHFRNYRSLSLLASRRFNPTEPQQVLLVYDSQRGWQVSGYRPYHVWDPLLKSWKPAAGFGHLGVHGGKGVASDLGTIDPKDAFWLKRLSAARRSHPYSMVTWRSLNKNVRSNWPRHSGKKSKVHIIDYMS